MPAITRIGDLTEGICDLKRDCCPHGRVGTNAEGVEDVTINGIPVHLVDHTGPTNCPHGGTFRSIEGRTGITVHGRLVTCVGDRTVCMSCGVEGKHITGSPNVTSG